MIAGGNHTSASCREAAKGVQSGTLSSSHSTNDTPSVSLTLDSSPTGEPSLTAPERGGRRIAPEGSGAVRRIPGKKAEANSYNPSWLPDGGAGRPNGLTCAPAGAMQASNRRQAALGESQRGCGSLNGNSSKSPPTPPLPLRGTSPKGGSERIVRIRPRFHKTAGAYRNPSAAAAAAPLSGALGDSPQ